MNKTKLLIIFLASIALLFLMTGCKEETGLSIDDRIEEFVSDLNDSNRNGIFKEHFHSNSGSYHGDESTVDAVFPNGTGYKVTSLSGSGSSRSVGITGGDGSANGTYTFNMKEEDDDDWYILSLNGPGGSL